MRTVNQIILSVILFCCFTGCEEKPSDPPLETYFIQKTSTRDFDVNKVKQLLERDHPRISGWVDKLPAKEIRVDALSYRSVDPQGKNIVASGIISYPKEGDIRGVVVGQHFTILSNSEAPSVCMFLPESLFSMLGYAVISTDYIGYGKTADLPHPYLHVESTGQLTVDMIFAAREYMASIGKSIDRPMYVVGYSQGGQAALAFQKVAEEKYSDKLSLIKVFAGGGPYDLTGTYDELIHTDYTGYPCSVPFISIGLDYGDNLNINFANIFKEPLLSNYQEWYNSKKYKSTEVNEFIGSNVISDFMSDAMFTPDRNADIDKLYTSLMKNSLVNWNPKTEIWMLHAKNDTYVPYLNAENAYKSFLRQGCKITFESGEGDHMDVILKFYLHVINELK